MVTVPDAHVKPVLVSDSNRRRWRDDEAIVTLLLGAMRNPRLAARNAVPGKPAIAAERDPHIVGTFPRPRPGKGMLRAFGPRPTLDWPGLFLQHRPAIGCGAIGMKPTE